MLKLEFPNQNHKKSYEILIQEWEKSENIPTSPWKLFAWENFEEFLEIIQEDTINNSNWVNSHLFFLIENQEILWAIHIRHHINHPNLIEKWGHIWYGIAPKFRQKWYATKMLELWLIEAKKLWIQKALLTCDIDNIWSNKVILKNGWVFERVTSDGTANRYWIEL